MHAYARITYIPTRRRMIICTFQFESQHVLRARQIRAELVCEATRRKLSIHYAKETNLRLESRRLRSISAHTRPRTLCITHTPIPEG